MPAISVIIPVYNVKKWLPRCLDSLLAQTFTDFEAICINDGSSDSSLDILDEYAQKDSRIKIITQENQGLSMARNNGIRNATGEYIYFLDSDDCIHPQTLEIAYYFITKHNAEMVCFGFVKNTGNGLPDIVPIKIEDIKYHMTDRPLYFNKKEYKIRDSVWTKIYKKEILNDLKFIPHIQFEDYPHTLAIMSKEPKTVILNEKLYFYTFNESSISHSTITPQQIKDYHTGINFIYETYHKPELKAEYKYVCHKYIPKILKQQLKRCRNADKETKPKMFKAFAEELRDLRAKKMLSWRGHELIRYLCYLWIMRTT